MSTTNPAPKSTFTVTFTRRPDPVAMAKAIRILADSLPAKTPKEASK